MLTWLAIVLLVACGMTDPRVYQSSNPEFAPYIRTFEAETGTNVRNFPVNFGEIDEDHAGEAWVYSNLIESYCEVMIDEEFWREHVDRRRRELLISHELGHCSGLEHNESKFSNGEPKSIMYPRVMVYGLDHFDGHRDQYYAELIVALAKNRRDRTHMRADRDFRRRD